MKTDRKWIVLGIILLIILIVIVNRADEWVTSISYPLNVWRMDLDDIFANIGLFMVGAAAIWTVKLKADSANHKIDKLENQFNGGLARAARDHVQDNEVIISMNHRLNNMEKERNKCLEDIADLRYRIDKLGDL